MRQALLVTCVVSANAFLVASARGEAVQVLYDVGFGSPPHTVGMPPVTGFGALPRSTPSIQRGTVVDASVTDIPGAALSLAPPAGSSSAVSFWMGKGRDPRTGDPGLGVLYPTYVVQMHVVIQALLPSPLPGDNPDFKLELESPFPNQLRFTHDGAIRAITFQDDGIVETRVGSFEFGRRLHVRLTADLASNWWSVDLDGARVFQGFFPNAGSLWGVNVVLDRNSMPGAAGIDNVWILGVPEPAVGVLLLVGIWTATLCRCKVLRRR